MLPISLDVKVFRNVYIIDKKLQSKMWITQTSSKTVGVVIMTNKHRDENHEPSSSHYDLCRVIQLAQNNWGVNGNG